MRKPIDWENDDPMKNKALLVKFSYNDLVASEKNPNKHVSRKSQPINYKQFWFRHIIEFLRITPLHGYKYIAMDNETIIERIFWAIAVMVCLVVSVLLVGFAWDWNASNPTLTVIESTHFPIWRYPYPAVTICSLNSLSLTTAITMSKSLARPSNVSSEDLFFALKHVTAILGNMDIDDELNDKMEMLQKVIEHNNQTVIEFLNNITPECKEILQRCSWKGSTTRCDSLFQRIISTSGFCCSFNYYGVKNNTYTDKVSFFTPLNPRRVASCGYQTALSVLFKIKPYEYYSSTFGTYGVRLFIHYSYDFPDENSPSKLVGPGMETFFAIAPEMTYSTPGVASFPIITRNCVFAAERKLNVLAKYTYNNCLAECRGDIVYKYCKCVPYFLPNNGSRPTCDFKKIRCVYNLRSIYTSSFPNANGTTCDCLPDCQHFVYPLELSTGNLVKTNSFNSLSFFKDINITNQSLSHVYFNDLVATRYRKDVYMNWHNLLASFGGLLGLFLGFSLVSGFEVVYFFTLRVFFDISQKKKKIDSEKNIWEHPSQPSIHVKVVSLSDKESSLYPSKSPPSYSKINPEINRY